MKLKELSYVHAEGYPAGEMKHGPLDIEEGSMDDFMNRMGLGDPDPSNYKTGFDSADEIRDWFQRDKPDDWRQRD